MNTNWHYSRMLKKIHAPIINWPPVQTFEMLELFSYSWCRDYDTITTLSKYYPSYIKDLARAIENKPLHTYSGTLKNIIPEFITLLSFFSHYPELYLIGPSITNLFLMNAPVDEFNIPYYERKKEQNTNQEENLSDDTGTALQDRIIFTIISIQQNSETLHNIIISALSKLNTSTNNIQKSYIYESAKQTIVRYKIASPRIVIDAYLNPFPSLNHFIVSLTMNVMGIIWSPSNMQWILSEQGIVYATTRILIIISKKNGPGIEAYNDKLKYYYHRSLIPVLV